MIALYHHPICPFSRQARVYLKEIDQDFTQIKEDYWRRRKDFIDMNPAGNLPVINLGNGSKIVGIYAIAEYIAEQYAGKFFFMPEDVILKAEVRRLLNWFNEKFYRDVTKVVIDEKMIRLMMRAGSPRTDFLKMAKSNSAQHLEYLSNLLRYKNYLVNEKISCADIAASCHISVLDYFGEINWSLWPEIKEWYSVIKSRPSFRNILNDTIPGFMPPPHYLLLDF